MSISKKRKKKKFSIILNIVLAIIAGIIIYEMWDIYKLNDFGDFIKAEYKPGKAVFSRDNNVKYSDMYSYKIDSNEFNDALIYKKIDVEKDTAYRVTAMVKFENVENEKTNETGGVNIGIMDTNEKSDSLTGSGDWQLLSFQFDSKDRTNVDIVFRLGCYEDNSKGTVWFSDFTFEKGDKNEDTNWNFICLIMKNINVEIEKNGEKVKTSMELNPSEIELIESNMKRFQNSMKEISRRIDDGYI